MLRMPKKPRMNGSIIIMMLPTFLGSRLWLFALHSLTKTEKDLQVIFLGKDCAIWFVIHQSTGVKEIYQPGHHIAADLPCFFFFASKIMGALTVRTAYLFLGHTHKPTTHHPVITVFRKFGHSLRCSACFVRFPTGDASAPLLAALARVSLTLFSFLNPQA
ncbi:hypothetical protein NPIL_317651 [Nephila pilipes]|uniref:Uncharacterized protein n=1 Tax=Nephila pilipes TaxID=299642 RepID=A0A8X6JW73_NEPPI|nr:hypothetical protein NPIL_317651 [Nephila pilipes]